MRSDIMFSIVLLTSLCVYSSLFAFVSVQLWPFALILVYSGLFVSIRIQSCLFALIRVYLGLFVPIRVYSGLFVSIRVYSCPFAFIRVYSFLFLFPVSVISELFSLLSPCSISKSYYHFQSQNTLLNDSFHRVYSINNCAANQYRLPSLEVYLIELNLYLNRIICFNIHLTRGFQSLLNRIQCSSQLIKL